jgi:hypothetical protein
MNNDGQGGKKMKLDKLHKYSSMMPAELIMLVNGAPKTDMDWGLIMYLFENTKSGNVITLGKMSNFFNVDRDILFERLDRINGLWIRHYLNVSEYGKTYGTYEITEIAADFMVKLIELLEMRLK